LRRADCLVLEKWSSARFWAGLPSGCGLHSSCPAMTPIRISLGPKEQALASSLVEWHGLIAYGPSCGWSAIWREGQPFSAREFSRAKFWKALPISRHHNGFTDCASPVHRLHTM
jgi:hypothetical protein